MQVLVGGNRHVTPSHRLLSMKGKKRAAAELHLYSDQGADTSPDLRRVNSYGTAMAENSFSILKSECISRHNLSSFAQARSLKTSSFTTTGVFHSKQSGRRFKNDASLPNPSLPYARSFYSLFVFSGPCTVHNAQKGF